MTAAVAVFAWVAANAPQRFERIPKEKRVLPKF
jgi:hypothetical protein